MSASDAERSRAKRLRQAQRAGALSDEDARWLEDYKAARDGERVSRRGARPTEEPASPAIGITPELAPDGAAVLHDPPPAPAARAVVPAAPSEQRVPIGAPAASSAPLPPAAPVAASGPTCSIEGCTACKVVSGGQTCGVTGQTVYPPMTIAGARSQARGLFGVIRIIAGWLGKPLPAPRDDEIEALAKALRDVAHRRANVLGAFDDLFQLAEAASSYGIRAIGSLEAQKREARRLAAGAPA